MVRSALYSTTRGGLFFTTTTPIHKSVQSIKMIELTGTNLRTGLMKERMSVTPSPELATSMTSTTSRRRLKYWPTMRVAASRARPTPTPDHAHMGQDFAIHISMTPLSLTLRCQLYLGARLCGVNDTAEQDSAMSMIPRSKTLRCQ